VWPAVNHKDRSVVGYVLRQKDGTLTETHYINIASVVTTTEKKANYCLLTSGEDAFKLAEFKLTTHPGKKNSTKFSHSKESPLGDVDVDMILPDGAKRTRTSTDNPTKVPKDRIETIEQKQENIGCCTFSQCNWKATRQRNNKTKAAALKKHIREEHAESSSNPDSSDCWKQQLEEALADNKELKAKNKNSEQKAKDAKQKKKEGLDKAKKEGFESGLAHRKTVPTTPTTTPTKELESSFKKSPRLHAGIKFRSG
jgi:hypothetical protein